MGPCLCGDTHCASCGDPIAAELADEVSELQEWLFENIETMEELAVVRAAAEATSCAFKKAIAGFVPVDKNAQH